MLLIFFFYCSEWCYIPYYAHTHALIVQTTITVIKNGKEKVEAIMHCLKYSAQVLAKLRSTQKEDTNT